jgi:O-antigen/teichoic acid export membrane protein
MSILKKRFKQNILFGGISRVLQTLVGFFLISFVIQKVGMVQWGELTLCISTISLLSILQISISGGTSKRLSDYYYKINLRDYSKYFSGTIVITVFIALIIAILIIGYDLFIGNSDSYRDIYYLVGLSSIFQLLNLPFISIFESLNLTQKNSQITSFGLIFRTLLVISFFQFFPTISCYTAILVAENIFIFLLLFYFVFRNHKRIVRFSFKGIDIKYLSGILSFNFFNLINSINYVLFIQLPGIIVAKKYGLTFSGYYGIGVQLNNLFRGFVSIIINALSPIFNILNAKEKSNELSLYFLISSKFFIVIALLLVVGSLFYSPVFLSLWLGENSKELIGFISIYLIFTAVGIAFIPAALMIITLEKLKFTSVLGLVLSILLPVFIYYFEFGKYFFILVPIVICLFFLFYNLQRLVICFRVLRIQSSEIFKIFTFITLSIGGVYLFHTKIPSIYQLNGIFVSILILILSFFLFSKKEFSYFTNILKK